jgi:hypothetical protein
MDDQDCLETIAWHASSIEQDLSFGVLAHRAHASADPRHRVDAVHLVAEGGGHDAGYLLLCADSRELAGKLSEAAYVIKWPGLDPIGVAADRAAGLAPQLVEAGRAWRLVMVTDTGLTAVVLARLSGADRQPGSGDDRSCVLVSMAQDTGPELSGAMLAPADAWPLASSLLTAADKASPCTEQVGSHPGRRGDAAVAVTVHRAHDHPAAWHHRAAISMIVSSAEGGAPARVVLSAADAGELISGVLLPALLVAGSPQAPAREFTTENDWYEPAGYMLTRPAAALIRTFVHIGHEDAGDEGGEDEDGEEEMPREDHKLTFVELTARPGGGEHTHAYIELMPAEVARLAGTLERAIGLVQQG